MKQKWQDILLVRMSSSMKIMVVIAVVALLVAAQAQATIAYSRAEVLLSNQQKSESWGPWMMGDESEVNSAIKVTRVGASPSETGFSLGANASVAVYGLAVTEPVRTWSEVGGTDKALFGTKGRQVGSARFQNPDAAVPLLPGAYALVAASYGVEGANNWDLSSPSLPRGNVLPMFQSESIPVAMVTDKTGLMPPGYSSLGAGSPTPSGAMWGATTPASAGDTFEFTPVPEVAAFGVACVGLLGLVYIVRYARLRRKMKPA